MLTSISYFQIIGKPFIFWLGIINLVFLLFTAYIGFSNKRGNHRISMKIHYLMAKITILFVLIHGILGILAYL